MSDILVAYFSVQGHTRRVAKDIAEVTMADLYEIKPAVPYTAEDIDWHNEQSRSSIECNDPKSRPAIDGKVENMDQYRIIFLGFPIWWYAAPRIIETFVESYDLQGKVIIPFCTSGSSDIGDSGLILGKDTKASVKQGRRFPNNVSKGDLATWANIQKFAR
jgi:flavodoxin